MPGQTGWGRSLAPSSIFGGIMIEPLGDKIDPEGKHLPEGVTVDDTVMLKIAVKVLKEKINEIIEHINNA